MIYSKGESPPDIAQLVEHLTVDIRSDQMVPGSIPGGRIALLTVEEQSKSGDGGRGLQPGNLRAATREKGKAHGGLFSWRTGTPAQN